MEAELDAQVARIEKQALEKAKLENEVEKRELEEKMEAELQELKAQLRLFQKVSALTPYKTNFSFCEKRFRFTFYTYFPLKIYPLELLGWRLLAMHSGGCFFFNVITKCFILRWE